MHLLCTTFVLSNFSPKILCIVPTSSLIILPYLYISISAQHWRKVQWSTWPRNPVNAYYTGMLSTIHACRYIYHLPLTASERAEQTKPVFFITMHKVHKVHKVHVPCFIINIMPVYRYLDRYNKYKYMEYSHGLFYCMFVSHGFSAFLNKRSTLLAYNSPCITVCTDSQTTSTFRTRSLLNHTHLAYRLSY